MDNQIYKPRKLLVKWQDQTQGTMTSLWENFWALAFMVVTPGLVVESTGKLKASESWPFKAESCHCSIQIQDKEIKDR